MVWQGWSKVDCTTEWFCEHFSILPSIKQGNETYLRIKLELGHRPSLGFDVVRFESQSSILIGDFATCKLTTPECVGNMLVAEDVATPATAELARVGLTDPSP